MTTNIAPFSSLRIRMCLSVFNRFSIKNDTSSMINICVDFHEFIRSSVMDLAWR